PAETVLQRVLASSPSTSRVHVVLLDELAGFAEHGKVLRDPALCNPLRERVLAVAPQTFDRQPLQRCPPVWRAPLFARFDCRRAEAMWREQALAQRACNCACLRLVRNPEVQWVDSGGAHSLDPPSLAPVVVDESALGIAP